MENPQRFRGGCVYLKQLGHRGTRLRFRQHKATWIKHPRILQKRDAKDETQIEHDRPTSGHRKHSASDPIHCTFGHASQRLTSSRCTIR